MAVIELKNLSKYSKKRPALVNTNLVVEDGDFFGIVGPNGSGKSTIVDILLNYIPIYSGTVSVLGMNPKKFSNKIKTRCGYVPADPDFLLTMRGSELLDITANVRKCKNFDKIISLCKYFNLDQDKRIGKMTVSECKLLALINATFFEPDLLILDEPSIGLNNNIIEKVYKFLIDLNKKGTTIFMTTNNIDEVNKLCSRFAVIHKGSVLEVREKEMLLTSDVRRISMKVYGDISPIFALFDIKDLSMNGDYITFLFKGNINELLEAFHYYKIDDIQIALPALSDIISDIYESKNNKEVSV